jgi:hypothetical protein
MNVCSSHLVVRLVHVLLAHPRRSSRLGALPNFGLILIVITFIIAPRGRRLRRLVLAEEKLQRRDEDARRRVFARVCHEVHRARVAPHVAPVQVRDHRQRFLRSSLGLERHRVARERANFVGNMAFTSRLNCWKPARRLQGMDGSTVFSACTQPPYLVLVLERRL